MLVKHLNEAIKDISRSIIKVTQVNEQCLNKMLNVKLSIQQVSVVI